MFKALLALLFTVSAHAEDLNLCALGLEGTYSGVVGSSQARVNLFCVDQSRMMATVCPYVGHEPTADAVTNLSKTFIDATRITFANFDITPEGRASGSSKAQISYTTIELAALRAHKLIGYYFNGNMLAFANLTATRSETYPQITPIARLSLSGDQARGVFKLDPGTSWPDSNLIFDVLDGVPVISLIPRNSHMAIHFSDGLAWDGTGVFSLATAEGNGGEPDDRRLFSIRGRFLDINRIEFYVISPTKGLQGPLHAQRSSEIFVGS